MRREAVQGGADAAYSPTMAENVEGATSLVMLRWVCEQDNYQTERQKAMSKRSKRIALILVGVAMAFLAVAQHFGWIAGPPPLLAPGV
jgi:hypothetical protein